MFAVMPLAAVLLLRDGTTARATRVGRRASRCAVREPRRGLLAHERSCSPKASCRRRRACSLEPHPIIKLLVVPAQSAAELDRAVRAARPFRHAAVVLARRRRLSSLIMVLGLHLRRARRSTAAALAVRGAAVLPFVAHSVSLAASSQAIGYRTLLPLSGLFLVLFVFGVASVVAARDGSPRAAENALLGVLLVGRRRARAAQRVDADRGAARPRVAALTGRGESLAARRATRSSTSFGRASTTARRSASTPTNTARCRRTPHWAAEEMFKAAMRQRFPNGCRRARATSLATSFGRRRSVLVRLSSRPAQAEEPRASVRRQQTTASRR